MTTLKGAAAGRYYTEHLPSYYLDGDEPSGRWWGRGAELLGLTGDVEAEAFLAVMAGQNPATGDDLGRRYGEGSVRGYDATFSAPKSVSVLFGIGDEEVRNQVVEAHERAVAAVLGWVEDHAHTRMRRRHHVVTVDADGIVVGLFRQHTSRKLDPQLHTHAVIANRVKAPDGRWLALDARTIKLDQRTLSALYHAGLRAELTRRLGVRWVEPEHGIAEIAGFDSEVLAEFSQRTTDVERRFEEKLRRFCTELGRDPTDQERWRMEREAVVDSRPSKPHGHTAAELRHEWRHRVRGLGHDPERLIATTLGWGRLHATVDPQMAAEVVDRGLASLAERQSTWRPAELVRELAAAVPTSVGTDSGKLTGLLEELALQVAAERCVDVSRPAPARVPLRRDGRPISEAAVDRALTTRAILDEEEQLLIWAQRRHDPDPSPSQAPSLNTVEADTARAEAAAAVASSSGLELIVGPAGAGKTSLLTSAATRLREERRRVFGVAPTAAAAEVLATETGMRTDTLDKLLSEHLRPDRLPHPEYVLPRGTTVVVDEAGTAATPKLAELARLADRLQWRVVLVGDPRQFSAVGRGGMFAHLVESFGAVELDQVHRFRHRWERTASLRLRSGDPGVLTDYERRGRLHSGTQDEMEASIVDAWHHARRRGETVALMANNTATVARLNRLAQHTRITSGELDTATGRLVGEEWMLVGDEVVTRRNNRTLRTSQGLMVKNRDHWTLTAIHPDASISLTGRTGTIRLPATYVAEHVQLGYAQTSHATQGRTVDTALLLIDTPTDSRGIYTPMTRGRDSNHAFVATEDNQTALDVLTRAVTRDWIDQPAIVRRSQLRYRDRSTPGRDVEDDFTEMGRRTEELIAQRRARSRKRERGMGIGR
ncbi:MAG: relaxase domain-containing protein [Acidobacteria bacterium]|nr:relaxase domain-containing protein [Acidobacteriota bacterium]